MDDFEISINFVYLCLSIHINNIKFRYDKLKSVKFGFRIFDLITFSQVYGNFTFLIYSINEEIQTFLQMRIGFLIQLNLATDKQTNRQTDKNCDFVRNIADAYKIGV